MDLVIVWGKFLLLLILVLIFGNRAARSADIIAEKKGLAKAFMGVVFISMVTSFPELFTGISAGAIVKAPDIAVGQILGSCVFNLFIIGVIEVFYRKKKLYQNTGKANIVPLGFSLAIIAAVTLFLSIGAKMGWQIFHVGVTSIIVFAMYILFMRVIFKDRKAEGESEDKYKDKNLKRELWSFVTSALVIIAVGIYLPIVGEELARLMHWSNSFVGVIFLALVTSFPEFVVSFSTARMGAFDMLLGNIIGSNLFNIAIIFIIDLSYLKGNVLTAASQDHVTVGLIAVLMNFVVFFAVIRHSSYRLFNFISINGILLIGLYVVNLLVLL